MVNLFGEINSLFKMAKKHRRFGALHKSLKDSGFTATSGPTGEYFNYLKGTNKIVVARRPSSAYLQRFNVGVTPFDIDVPTGANVITAYQGLMTVQGNNILKAVTDLTDAVMGIQRDLTQTKEVAGFYPALAHITVAATGQTATKGNKTSGITKRAYTAINTRSGGVAYGRSTGVKDSTGAAITDLSKCSEEDSRAFIMETAKGKTYGNWIVKGISFSPETHPEAGIFGVALGTTGVPTDIPAS